MAGRRRSMAGSRDVVKEILQTPPNDRTEDDIRVLQGATGENKFFLTQSPATHKECCKCMVLQRVAKEEVLFSQGDHGDSFFIIHTGAVSVIVNGKQVAHLDGGAAFGELSLIKAEPRAATIAAAEDCELMKLVKADFDRILAGDTGHQMRRKTEFLQTLPLFSTLPPSELEGIGSTFLLKHVNKGKQLVREGGPSDSVYLVMTGRFKLVWNKQHSEHPDRKVPKYYTVSDVMGGDDALHDRPHTFSAFSTEDCEVYVVSKEDYLQVLSKEEDHAAQEEQKTVVAKLKSEGSSEYAEMVTMINFIKEGQASAVIVAMSRCLEFDLTDIKFQFLFFDLGGVEALFKLLKCDKDKLRIAALQMLRDLSENPRVQTEVANLGGIQLLVDLLRNQKTDEEVKFFVCEALSKICRNLRNRLMLRKFGGLGALVDLLRPENGVPSLDTVQSTCGALAQVCQNNRNRMLVRYAGLINNLNVILSASTEDSVLLPVVRLIQELVLDHGALADLHKAGAIDTLMECLKSKNEQVLMAAIDAIYRAAADESMRTVISKGSGMKDLIGVLGVTSSVNVQILTVASISECAKSLDNAEIVNNNSGIDSMVRLLVSSDSDQVKINVAGALWNCVAVSERSRELLRTSGGLDAAVGLLKSGAKDAMLENVTGLLWGAALDSSNRRAIGANDGMRLLFSLLRNKPNRVKANASGALSILLDDPDNLMLLQSKLMGGIPWVLDLLVVNAREVQSNACAVVGVLCKSDDIVGIMTEQGLCDRLANLVHTPHDPLRKQLAFAIAQTASYHVNAATFGLLNAVKPLAAFLESEDDEVLEMTCVAMLRLSEHPQNAIALRQVAVVPRLVELLGSSNHMLSFAAAGTLSHIRLCYAERMANSVSRRQAAQLTTLQLQNDPGIEADFHGLERSSVRLESRGSMTTCEL